MTRRQGEQNPHYSHYNGLNAHSWALVLHSIDGTKARRGQSIREFDVVEVRRGVLPIALLWAGQVLAQSAVPLNNTDLSKKPKNPVARQITVPLRQNSSRLACPSHRGVKSIMSESGFRRTTLSSFKMPDFA
jgi:hypothetical protein